RRNGAVRPRRAPTCSTPAPGRRPRARTLSRLLDPGLRATLAPVIFPPPLRPGDAIAVIAPSSPFDRALAFRGLGWLAERYRVRFSSAMMVCDGYLAGSDERRLDELQRALRADVRAVVAARGGYGLGRIAHRVEWDAALRNPRWLVGFSDLTALHVEA